ncbi:MAG: hypothetical protein R2698_04250 [Microthrixaceae bacterium]
MRTSRIGVAVLIGMAAVGVFGSVQVLRSRVRPPSTASSVAMGERHACAVVSGGAVRCWGAGSFGQLGNGTTQIGSGSEPVRGVVAPTVIAAGDDYTCSVEGSGAVMCWGLDTVGQLGDGRTDAVSALPSTVAIPPARSVAAGLDHACALGKDRRIRCWGGNEAGQLGTGFASRRSTPVLARLAPTNARLVAAGDRNTCAVSDRATITCWGRGPWATADDASAVARSRIESGVVSDLDVGGTQVCVTVSDRSVMCAPLDRPRRVVESGRARPLVFSAVDGVGADLFAVGERVACAAAGGSLPACWSAGESTARIVDRVPLDELGVGGSSLCGIAVAGHRLHCFPLPRGFR